MLKSGLTQFSTKVTFDYSKKGKPFEEQARAQGFTLDNRAESFDQLRQAVYVVSLHLCSDKQKGLMLDKLHILLMKNLRLIP